MSPVSADENRLLNMALDGLETAKRMLHALDNEAAAAKSNSDHLQSDLVDAQDEIADLRDLLRKAEAAKLSTANDGKRFSPDDVLIRFNGGDPVVTIDGYSRGYLTRSQARLLATTILTRLKDAGFEND